MPTPFITGSVDSTTTTAADWINRTRRHLNTGLQEGRNKLASSSTSTLGTEHWTFTYPLDGIQPGSVLGVGLENVYVWDTDATVKTATVERGWEGSPTSAHANGDQVHVNPRFSDFHIVTALNDDLRSLSSAGLYAVQTLTFTYDGTARTYDLAADLIDVLEVRYHENSSSNYWPLIDSYQVLRDMPIADFPSGVALRLDGGAESGRDVLVRYKTAFGSLSSVTDDAELTTGLHPEAHDIPPLGAAIRLAGPRDIRRTDTVGQGDTRRSEEVGTGAPQSAVRDLENRRRTRIAEEASRLYARYPLRRLR